MFCCDISDHLPCLGPSDMITAQTHGNNIGVKEMFVIKMSDENWKELYEEVENDWYHVFISS